MFSRQSFGKKQLGFSLVELMVAMVIGLIVTGIISQVVSLYGSQKRTTSGVSDAQTNGTFALYAIQRELQQAGYGLPLFDTENPPLKCNLAGIAMVNILTGATSDTITVRYGDSAFAGTPVKMLTGSAGASAVVSTSLGCKVNDDALITKGTSCDLKKVKVVATGSVTLNAASANNVEGASLSCLGAWRTVQFNMNANQLVRSENGGAAESVGAEIVAIKAQYGISSTAADNVVTSWSSVMPADRNQIKAMRVAVVARSGLREKTAVTTVAPVAWDAASAPIIDLSGDPEWQQYRYRVFETIIPLRNMIWSKETLT